MHGPGAADRRAWPDPPRLRQAAACLRPTLRRQVLLLVLIVGLPALLLGHVPPALWPHVYGTANGVVGAVCLPSFLLVQPARGTVSLRTRPASGSCSRSSELSCV